MTSIINIIFLAGLLVSVWFIFTRRGKTKTVDQVPDADGSTAPLTGSPVGA